MTDEVPGRPSSGGLVQALNVPQNAKRGVAAGVVLAVGVYLFRVLELLGPFAGTRQYPILGAEGWFLLLAFVLASATALLVTALLTVVTAVKLARELS